MVCKRVLYSRLYLYSLWIMEYAMNEYDEEMKVNRFNTAQWYFNSLKTNILVQALPEWMMVQDYGRLVEMHFMTYGKLPEIDLYCRAIKDTIDVANELGIDLYWQDTLDALGEL